MSWLYVCIFCRILPYLAGAVLLWPYDGWGDVPSTVFHSRINLNNMTFQVD